MVDDEERGYEEEEREAAAVAIAGNWAIDAGETCAGMTPPIPPRAATAAVPIDDEQPGPPRPLPPLKLLLMLFGWSATADRNGDMLFTAVCSRAPPPTVADGLPAGGGFDVDEDDVEGIAEDL